MLSLTRFTTEYDPVEDRVRLSGETGDGSYTVVWLTRRLLDRLLPELLRWLEENDSERDLPRADVLQEFKQQAARERHEAQPPVAAPESAPEWLVKSVDVQRRGKVVRLVWRSAGDEHRAGVDFHPLGLRQWLNILMTGYARGGWPLDPWPEWMREQVQERTAVSPSSLH